MYRIERRPSGFILTFEGIIAAEEMGRWLAESRQELATVQAPYGVIVDMRRLAPLPPEAQKVMIEGQQLYKARGMQRSAVILANTILTLQFKRLAQESGIYAWERYLDASRNPDWSEAAVKWVRDGTDPDAP